MKQTAVDYLYNQIKSFGIDTGFLNKSFEQAKEMEKQQVEISDEEIEKAGWDYELNQIGDGYEHHFIEGAKWYREQLKSRQ